MWALVKANQVIKIFNGAQAFEHNDIKHPANIFSSWSDAEKAAIGLYPVQTDNSNYKDPTFYKNRSESFQFDATNKVVKKVWKTAEDHEMGTKKVNEVNNQAYTILKDTDWMVIKASEVSNYSLPDNVSKFRTAVRAKSNDMVTRIKATKDVRVLETLYTYTNTGTESKPVMTRPLGEFPKLEDF
jgi:inorganic triphosphatase YgiF